MLPAEALGSAGFRQQRPWTRLVAASAVRLRLYVVTLELELTIHSSRQDWAIEVSLLSIDDKDGGHAGGKRVFDEGTIEGFAGSGVDFNDCVISVVGD